MGVDVQAGMIARLERNAAKSGVTNIRGVVADAARMDLPRETFDVVFIALTLGEIAAPPAALLRAFDVLKRGGTLAVTELFPDPHFLPRRRVRKMAEDAGFEHAGTHGGPLYFTATFIKPLRAAPAPEGSP